MEYQKMNFYPTSERGLSDTQQKLLAALDAVRYNDISYHEFVLILDLLCDCNFGEPTRTMKSIGICRDLLSDIFADAASIPDVEACNAHLISGLLERLRELAVTPRPPVSFSS